MSFQARRLIANADWHTGEPAQFEDITADVLAMKNDECRIVVFNGSKMTKGTADDHRRASRVPRPDTRPGQSYDATRAKVYFQMMTGLFPRDVIFAKHTVGDEKFPRVQFVTYEGGKWEIPHWDFIASYSEELDDIFA